MSNSLFPSLVSYANAAAALGYANAAQKLVAVPGYTQAAYRTVVASPTPTSAYTTAYIQPTGVSPIKVGSETPPFYQNWTGHDVVLLILPGFTFIEKISFFFAFLSHSQKQYTVAQPQNYYGSAATTYAQKLAYAQPATSYLSSLQAANANQILSAQATNSAIQYAAPQQIYQPSALTAAKYSYSQLPTAQKFFYASS